MLDKITTHVDFDKPRFMKDFEALLERVTKEYPDLKEKSTDVIIKSDKVVFTNKEEEVLHEEPFDYKGYFKTTVKI